MNWDAITFDWNQARAFLVTAETGSFSAAGRALNLTQPTVGRQVAALEEALNITLFERIGRSLLLTAAGEDLLDHMRVMGEAAARASLIASGRSEDVSGTVCISVTDVFATFVMPQVMVEMRQTLPDIRIDVLVSNDLSDLQRREADIAIRHVVPTQVDLISRKVREAQGRLYAHQRYLDRVGPITTPQDMTKVEIIGMGDDAEMLKFLHNWDLPVTVDNIRCGSAQGGLGWQLALQGVGVAPMSDDIADMSPEMQIILPDLAPIPVPYWLTTHRELHTAKRIRLVYDFLADFLGRKSLSLHRDAGRRT